MIAPFQWIVLIFCRLALTSADTTTTISPDLVEYICPSGFDLITRGQCRGQAGKSINIYANTGLQKSVDMCSALGAGPIIIKNEEDQAYWDSINKNNNAPIGITCNSTSKKWQWTDGSAIEFKADVVDSALSQDCATDGTWYTHQPSHWHYIASASTSSTTYDIYCISDLHNPSVSDEDCIVYGDSDSLCYQISDLADNWIDAQKLCKSAGYDVASIHDAQENSYIRRMAVSRGFVNGVLLGATVSGKGNTFGWIDGSEWNYTNFLPGFPVDGFGNCVVMDTNDINGKWANVDCSMKFPFACSRNPLAEPMCLGANVKEGDIVTTPGFPADASTPCDFFLIAEPGKIVLMEVVLLEANSCCDHLLLYEGEFNGSLIANLTGAMMGGVYRTTKSNVMRVSWQPNGGVNVRGAMITFRSV